MKCIFFTWTNRPSLFDSDERYLFDSDDSEGQFGVGVPVGLRGESGGAVEGGGGAAAEGYVVEPATMDSDGAVRLSRRKVAVGDLVGALSSSQRGGG